MRRFETKVVKAMDALQAVIGRLVIWGIIALLLIQLLMQYGPARRMLVRQLEYEGEPWSLPALERSIPVWASERQDLGGMSLELVGKEPTSRLKVLVDGMEVADFSEFQVNIPVKDGSIVTVDSRGLVLPLHLRVVATTENLKTPHPGLVIVVQNEFKDICEVRFK